MPLTSRGRLNLAPYLTQRLWTDPDAVKAILAERDAARVTPPNCALSTADVGMLLGISPIYVGELAEIERLPFGTRGTARVFDLYDIVAFNEVYLLSSELNAKLFITRRGGPDMFSQDSAFSTRHIRGWLRQEMSEFLANLERSGPPRDRNGLILAEPEAEFALSLMERESRTK